MIEAKNESRRAGRPVGGSGIRTRARQYIDNALSALDDVARNAADPAARVEAAKVLIGATLGKAVEIA